MEADLWVLYRLMFRSRRFEEIVLALWERGLISGEMHLGIGEEGIVAGVVSRLIEGDALALDHRGTSAMLMRGVDLLSLLREFLGSPGGLCRGSGGHMHLFSRELAAASSGIVGASGPAAAGFALAAQHLRPGTVAVAFFGEGAANQGMLLESFNLAAAWRLPVLFVCKDNDWAITTASASVTGGSLQERVRGFGLSASEVDGTDVTAVSRAAAAALEKARGGVPAFLLAGCARPHGHFLGDQLVRLGSRRAKAVLPLVLPLTRAVLSRSDAPVRERVTALRTLVTRPRDLSKTQTDPAMDPVARARAHLADDPERLGALEAEVSREIEGVVTAALAGIPEREMP